MKNIKLIVGVLLAFSIALVACKKNELRLTEFDLPLDKSYVKFALLSPGTPAVMIKVNNVKINGGNTTGSGGFFPATTNFPDYSAIAPGGVFKLSLPNIGTQNDSVVVFTGNLGLEANRSYSVVLSDTGANRTLFSVSDDFFSSTDSGFCFIRLINAMVNTPAGLHLVRVDSASATVVTRDTIARNIAYKAASLPIRVRMDPVNGFLRYRLVNAANLAPVGPALTPPQSPIANLRSFTMYATGFSNGIGATAPSATGFIYNK